MATPSASPATPAPKVAPGAPSRRPVNDLIQDEPGAIARFTRLRGLVLMQAWVITGLTVVFAIALPLSSPVYLYYGMNPEKQVMRMVGLDMPNMTNRAVLSWAVTSITEIMTMGFGDFDVKIPLQRNRFTPKGWEGYVNAFVKQKIGEDFKKSQLVLTTVPTNTPVIVSQFVNADNVYQWIVQMPVIMTYATNNNVTLRQSAVVTLTIVRVGAETSSAGIAIQKWDIHVGNT